MSEETKPKRRSFPRSLGFFLAAGLVSLLQVIPVVGVFLMFMAAALWSGVLINLGMVGVAYESLSRRVARKWLLVPLAFYSVYYAFALSDYIALLRFRGEIAAANTTVHIPFDPQQSVLVATSRGWDVIGGAWLVQNFDLPVFYERDPKVAGVYLATRMIDKATCADLRRTNARLAGVRIDISGFHDRPVGWSLSRLEKRFCMIRQPDWPSLPAFTVARSGTSERVGTLPVDLVSTTVTSPHGRRFDLRGGRASPLLWFPMPVVGCSLISDPASWDYGAKFLRANRTPFLNTDSLEHAEDLALAQALGLEPVSPENRRGADPGLVRTLAMRAEADALANDLAQLETVVAKPETKIDSTSFRVLGRHLDALTPRADAIMVGLERAARVGVKARNNGIRLTSLLSRLPPARFEKLGPRILALYAEADVYHWLWKADTLIDRLGDLGPEALPLLVAPASNRRPAVLRSVEAACRLGSAGRPLGPLLQGLWTGPRNSDERDELFVAMRRIGVEVPPLAEDKRDQAAEIAAEWDDIGPGSPARVCNISAERQARRKEKQNDAR